MNNIEFTTTTVRLFTESLSSSYDNRLIFLNSNGVIVATAQYYLEGLEADKPTSFTLSPAGRVVYYSIDTNKLYTTLSNNVNWISIMGVYSGKSTWGHIKKLYSFIPNNTVELIKRTDLDLKQDIITGAATTITASNLTANRVLISNTSGKVAVSAVTSTELGYLDGVTSNIQTQINNLNSKIQSTKLTISYHE